MPWQTDPAHSAIEFRVKHMLVATVRGHFKDFSIEAGIDEANLAASHAKVTITAASLESGVQQRDDHLRSGDFLDAANHPAIVFESRRIEQRGQGEYRLVGDLTIRDITREVVLDAEVSGPLTDPWGGTRLGISLQGKFNRKDFGLNWNVALEAGGVVVADTVHISADAELDKTAVPEPALVA